jgi:hypothetical protein
LEQDVDYMRIYREFIADRKVIEPTLTGYSERHHILPRSLGGSNDPENLIRLTAEDHYFAHCCLAKIYGGKMWSALARMRWSRREGDRQWVATRRMYGVARRKAADHLSKLFSGQPGKRGSDNARYDDQIYAWHNLDNGRVVNATKWQMWTRYGGSRAHWTSAAGGARKSMLGWTVHPKLSVVRSGKGKRFYFVNRDGREYTGTQGEFANEHGLSLASASRIVRHSAVSICGWRLVGSDDRLPTQARSGGYVWQHRKKNAARKEQSV